jgi:antiviral helicase SKI2
MNRRMRFDHGWPCVPLQAVYLWASGRLFRDITAVLPEGVMEGDIVRTVTRLEHACQDICSAARVMGNTALFDQFETASRLIKRDIIFAASLYIV